MSLNKRHLSGGGGSSYLGCMIQSKHMATPKPKPKNNRSATGKKAAAKKRTTKKTGREVTQFKPGESGNPIGRPVGARNRRTVLWAAISRIAEKKKMDPEEMEELIQVAGIEKAIKGSYFHYSEISNGLYGKVSDKVDITSGGKTLSDVLLAAHHAKKQKSKGR